MNQINKRMRLTKIFFIFSLCFYVFFLLVLCYVGGTIANIAFFLSVFLQMINIINSVMVLRNKKDTISKKERGLLKSVVVINAIPFLLAVILIGALLLSPPVFHTMG